MAPQPKHDREEIKRLYVEGYSPREIAAMLDTRPHQDFVGRIVREAGLSRRPGRPRRVLRCLDCGSENCRSEIR